MTMKSGSRTVGPASCRIRQTMALPAEMRERCRELSHLEVPAEHQGKGYATTLVHKMCREADAAGLMLVLWPQPFGEHVAMSREQLAAWYAREFGFVAIQPEPLLMARMVGATPRRLEVNPLANAAASMLLERVK